MKIKPATVSLQVWDETALDLDTFTLGTWRPLGAGPPLVEPPATLTQPSEIVFKPASDDDAPCGGSGC